MNLLLTRMVDVKEVAIITTKFVVFLKVSKQWSMLIIKLRYIQI